MNLLLGAELHIKNHDDVEAFHCHIYFNLDVTEENIKALNDILDKLYTNKLPCTTDQLIPDIQKVIHTFEPFEFMLLPHAGQRHGQFNYSLHEGEQVDNAIAAVSTTISLTALLRVKTRDWKLHESILPNWA